MRSLRLCRLLPDDAHPFGPRPFAPVAAGRDLVFNTLPDLQGVKEPSFDRGMVKEHVGPMFGLDEAESPVCDQLLDLSSFHNDTSRVTNNLTLPVREVARRAASVQTPTVRTDRNPFHMRSAQIQAEPGIARQSTGPLANLRT
jgi:hypothetical protein